MILSPTPLYQVSTSYTLWFPAYSPDKIFKLKVTMPRSKVKSKSHHDVAHLQAQTNFSTKYQLPTPFSFQDRAQTRFYGSRSLRQGQIKVTSWCCTPTTPNQCHYHVSTSYTSQFPRYSPDNILKVQVTTAKTKVKSRSHHDIAHLHPLTNVPTKCQLPTHYGFRDIAWTRFYISRSLRQSQGQIQVTPWRCTPTPPTNVSTKY